MTSRHQGDDPSQHDAARELVYRSQTVTCLDCGQKFSPKGLRIHQGMVHKMRVVHVLPPAAKDLPPGTYDVRIASFEQTSPTRLVVELEFVKF